MLPIIFERNFHLKEIHPPFRHGFYKIDKFHPYPNLKNLLSCHNHILNKFCIPLIFSKDEKIEVITHKLNEILEEMIRRNPEQWIWTHNRWK